uniref:Cytochrome b561 domain-containing protein n=1 Tax=Lotharella oceanica TaxID=641309 RepID=A0A7S2U3M9_9EUKA
MANASLLSLLAFLLVVLPSVYITPFTFSPHPVLLAASTLIASVQGILALFGKPLDRAQARERHLRMQLLSGVLMILGVGSILIHKAIMGKSLMPRTNHGVAGWVVVGLYVLQIIFGLAKHTVLLSTGQKVYRWHGLVGSWAWVGASINVATGTVLVLPSIPATLASAATVMLIIKVGKK